MEWRRLLCNLMQVNRSTATERQANAGASVIHGLRLSGKRETKNAPRVRRRFNSQHRVCVPRMRRGKMSRKEVRRHRRRLVERLAKDFRKSCVVVSKVKGKATSRGEDSRLIFWSLFMPRRNCEREPHV